MSPWETSSTTKPVVVCNGITHEVERSDPFVSTIKALAAGKGLEKFLVYIDGVEVDAHNAPEDFSEITRVEIKKFDEAA